MSELVLDQSVATLELSGLDQSIEISASQDTVELIGGIEQSLVLDGSTDSLELSTSQDSLELEATLALELLGPAGEINTGESLGSGAAVYKDKVGAVLRFRSITGGTYVDVTENANDVGVDVDTDALMADLNPQYTLLLDEVGSYTYIGEADPGTATSAAAWRIFRLDETASGDEELLKEWADGVDTFTKIWDNRASYSYS